MKQKLKINGFKKISSGKVLNTEILTLTDTKIKMIQYQIENKIYVMFETTFSFLGYTEDLDFGQELALATKKLSFDGFMILAGRPN